MNSEAAQSLLYVLFGSNSAWWFLAIAIVLTACEGAFPQSDIFGTLALSAFMLSLLGFTGLELSHLMKLIPICMIAAFLSQRQIYSLLYVKPTQPKSYVGEQVIVRVYIDRSGADHHYLYKKDIGDETGAPEATTSRRYLKATTSDGKVWNVDMPVSEKYEDCIYATVTRHSEDTLCVVPTQRAGQ